MTPDVTPEVVPAAPVIDVPVAPEVVADVAPIVEPSSEGLPEPIGIPVVESAIFPVRAEVTYNDGSVKTFSGQAEDSLLDVSQIK